jgi:Rrf2 family protein
MIAITPQTTYAIRCLVYLKDRAGETVPVREIASGTVIPAPFLNKVIRALTRHGLTKSARGHAGGIRLALPPEKISLYDVLLATAGGKTALKTPCSGPRGGCRRSPDCRARAAWADLDRVISIHLRSRKLSQL